MKIEVSSELPDYLLSKFTKVKQPNTRTQKQIYHLMRSQETPEKVIPWKFRPFQYQEMAFPAPDNKVDLHTLSLNLSYDYAKLESPRVRCRSDFYKKWYKRQSRGFQKRHGLCVNIGEMLVPARYQKYELDYIRQKTRFARSFAPKKSEVKPPVSPVKSMTPAVNHWTKYKRESLNCEETHNRELSEFEDKLPHVQVRPTFAYKPII